MSNLTSKIIAPKNWIFWEVVEALTTHPRTSNTWIPKNSENLKSQFFLCGTIEDFQSYGDKELRNLNSVPPWISGHSENQTKKHYYLLWTDFFSLNVTQRLLSAIFGHFLSIVYEVGSSSKEMKMTKFKHFSVICNTFMRNTWFDQLFV